MTTATSPSPATADAASLSQPLVARGTAAAACCFGVVVLIILAFYAALQNPYWMRHGDSEVFLSIGRSLVLGEGFRFGGQPVGIVPPGWPLILAAAMKVTAKLAVLKLIPMLCMGGFLAVSWVILNRFTTPLIASLCVVTAALLDPVFSLSNLFFSDAPFALLAVSALWLALRINDGADSWRNIALLGLLCAAMMFVRWAGIFWFVMIAAALLHGEFWPKPTSRRWIAVVISGVVTLGCFVSLRSALKVDASRIDPRYDSFISTNYDLDNTEQEWTDQLTRVMNFGLWISGLLYRPAVTYHPTRLAANIVGWCLAGLMLLKLVPATRRREWIWLAGAVYVGVLGANWPNPMPRYIVPAAPLLVLAVYEGIAAACRRLAPRHEWVGTLGLNVVFCSILLLNGLSYLSEAVVVRSPNFYGRYEAGVHKTLIDAAWYLNQQPRGNYEVAISQRWVNYDREAWTDGFRRALIFLTNCPIVTVDQAFCREPDREVIDWLKAKNVRYYLYQPPFWVRGHFASKSRGGFAIAAADTEWRLYEIVGDEARRVELEPTSGWPRHIPGL